MKRLDYVAIAAALLLVCCLPAGASDVQPTQGPIKPLARVNADLYKVDEADLDRLYQVGDDPVAHVLAAMSLERLHMNLDKSSEDAAACEKVLRHSRPDIAYYCALVASGNTRLDGRAQEAARMELAISQRFAGAMVATELAALAKKAQDEAALPDLRVTRPDHTMTIPLLRPAFGNGELFIDASANGKGRRLTLDTGAGFLLLDETTATDWGVHLAEGDPEQIQGAFNKVAYRKGRLDRLDVGGIVMENVPVQVVAKGPRVIGIDLLRWLGAIRIARESLTVYAVGDARPACQDPMVVASPRNGSFLRLITNVTVDGQARATLVDTGFAGYLSANASVLDMYKDGLTGHARMTDVSNNEHKAGTKLATQDVVIGSQPIRMTFAVFTDSTVPWGFVLGNLALQDMDFYLDFDNRHTCLLLHDKLH